MMSENASAITFIRTFPVGPLQCNCTIIGDTVSGEAILVDPGGSPERIMKILNEAGLRVTKIVHTHAHFDHFLAAGKIHEQTGAPLCLHQADKPLWQHLEMQCSRFNIPYEPVPEPHHWLEPQEKLQAGSVTGEALFTPGHTPGSMSFWFEENNLLLAGDTLFKGAIGRTDLWGGDYPTIEHSIQTQLYTLNESATVITGHGPSTTLGDEMRHNPYVRATTA